MASADLPEQRMSDPEVFENQLFRNFFVFTHQDTKTRVAVYESAREIARELIRMIEDQVRD